MVSDLVQQYQGFAQPVLTAAQQPETVSIDRWLQPLAEPRQAQDRLRSARRLLAVMASGESLSPAHFLPPETGDRDSRWDPPAQVLALQRARRGRVAALASGEFISPLAFMPPDAAFTSWHQPLAEPRQALNRRADQRRRVAIMASGEFISPLAFMPPDAGFIDHWLIPLAEPRRFKRGLRAEHQQPFWPSPSPVPGRPFAQGYIIL